MNPCSLEMNTFICRILWRFFFSSRRRHTRYWRDWSSDVCSSDLRLAADTKNYYGMKIETLKPGAMAISHFAVVEGKEVSSSQRPLAVDARPGAVYRVKLDVSGPRFTIAIGGEPGDFWAGNRLKTGAVGFMNERE